MVVKADCFFSKNSDQQIWIMVNFKLKLYVYSKTWLRILRRYLWKFIGTKYHNKSTAFSSRILTRKSWILVGKSDGIFKSSDSNAGQNSSWKNSWLYLRGGFIYFRVTSLEQLSVAELVVKWQGQRSMEGTIKLIELF